VLLKENQALAKVTRDRSVHREQRRDSGVLSRQDPPRWLSPQHADMKQRLDQLAESNTSIVTLIKAYAPQARTSAFPVEADKFPQLCDRLA